MGEGSTWPRPPSLPPLSSVRSMISSAPIHGGGVLRYRANTHHLAHDAYTHSSAVADAAFVALAACNFPCMALAIKSHWCKPCDVTPCDVLNRVCTVDS